MFRMWYRCGLLLDIFMHVTCNVVGVGVRHSRCRGASTPTIFRNIRAGYGRKKHSSHDMLSKPWEDKSDYSSSKRLHSKGKYGDDGSHFQIFHSVALGCTCLLSHLHTAEVCVIDGFRKYRIVRCSSPSSDAGEVWTEGVSEVISPSDMQLWRSTPTALLFLGFFPCIPSFQTHFWSLEEFIMYIYGYGCACSINHRCCSRVKTSASSACFMQSRTVSSQPVCSPSSWHHGWQAGACRRGPEAAGWARGHKNHKNPDSGMAEQQLGPLLL